MVYIGMFGLMMLQKLNKELEGDFEDLAGL